MNKSGNYKSVDFIIPVYNESEIIKEFVLELREYANSLNIESRLIVVDDGSKDGTDLIMHQMGDYQWLTFIRLSRNFGKEAALSAGLRFSNSDAAILIDADFQHPFSCIGKFISEWKKGFDMVYAIHSERDASFIGRHIRKFFSSLLTRISKANIPANAGDFRLLDKSLVISLNQFNETNRYMKGLYPLLTDNSSSFEYSPDERRAGVSKFSFKMLANLAFDGITSFSTAPLRLVIILGLFISIISIFFSIYIVLDTLFFGNSSSGWPSIIVAITFLFGLQFVFLGVVGLYVGKIFEEVKKRPLFIIDDSVSFNLSK
jgi:polyisoprenyl-phosphate glycosyltransferase